MAAKVERVRRTAGAGVEIRGLKELQAALSKVDKGLLKQVRSGNKTVAEMVAQRARARAAASSNVGRRVAPSIKAKGEARYAVITGGGPKFPEFFGANFGAYHDVFRDRATGKAVGDGKTVAGKQLSSRQQRALGLRPAGAVLGWNQFPQWGGNQFTGGARDLFMYRTIAELSPTSIEHRFLEVFEPLLAELGALTGA